MKRFVTVTGKDEGGEAGASNLYTQLFIQFPNQAFLWGFSGLNLTAGEFPEAGERFTLWSLSD